MASSASASAPAAAAMQQQQQQQQQPGKGEGGGDGGYEADFFEERESVMASTFFFKKKETGGYLDMSAIVQASVATPLPDDNRGMRLLLKMGWQKDTGLGKLRTGIVEPLQLADASLGYGLGKAEEYDTAAQEATRERRKLDVEVEETAEMKKQRQEKHEKAEQLKEDIKAMNRSFYCETCDKQYVNVGEWSNHMSSYDHHHTKRLKEMREATLARAKKRSGGNQAEQDRMRQDKEMQRRIAAAQASKSNKQQSGAGAGGFAIALSGAQSLPPGMPQHPHNLPQHPGPGMYGTPPPPPPPPPPPSGGMPMTGAPPPPPPPPEQPPTASAIPTERSAPVKLSISFGGGKGGGKLGQKKMGGGGFR